MTHKGRMERGKANVEAGDLLDNADTKYYLENKEAEKKSEPVKEEKPKAEKKSKKVKKDGGN